MYICKRLYSWDFNSKSSIGVTASILLTPDAIDDSDQVFENSNVKVVIDKFSFTHLEGGTLNFSDGLNGTGFGIENPNAKASCGCGSSFTV